MKIISYELTTFSQELIKCDKKMIYALLNGGGTIKEIVCKYCDALYSNIKILLNPMICDRDKIFNLDPTHVNFYFSIVDKLKSACTSISFESLNWMKNISCNWQELVASFDTTNYLGIGFFSKAKILEYCFINNNTSILYNVYHPIYNPYEIKDIYCDMKLLERYSSKQLGKSYFIANCVDIDRIFELGYLCNVKEIDLLIEALGKTIDLIIDDTIYDMFCYARNRMYSFIYSRCDVYSIYKMVQLDNNMTAVFSDLRMLNKLCPRILLTTGQLVREEIEGENSLDICTMISQLVISATNLQHDQYQLPTLRPYTSNLDMIDSNSYLYLYLTPVFCCVMSMVLGLLVRPYVDKFISAIKNCFYDNSEQSSLASFSEGYSVLGETTGNLEIVEETTTL